MYLMKDITRDGNPVLRKRAAKVSFPLSDEGHGQSRRSHPPRSGGWGADRGLRGLRCGRHHLHGAADGLPEKLWGQVPALYSPAD